MPKRFFDFMSHDERVDSICYGDWAKYPLGAILRKRGDEPSGLRVLLSGEADVLLNAVTITRLEAGDVYGEMSFARCRPATADVVATTDVTVLILRPDQIDRLLESHPRAAGALYRSLATVLARRLSLRLIDAQTRMLRDGSTATDHRMLLSGAQSSIY